MSFKEQTLTNTYIKTTNQQNPRRRALLKCQVYYLSLLGLKFTNDSISPIGELNNLYFSSTISFTTTDVLVIVELIEGLDQINLRITLSFQVLL